METSSENNNKPFAVIKSGGKQYKVSAGEKITVEKLDLEVGSSVVLKEIILGSNGTESKVGAPFLNGSTVSAKVLSHGKGEKLIHYRKTRRNGFTKKIGHRQIYTHLMIESLNIA